MPVEFIFNDFQFLWQLELIIKQLITIQQKLFDLRYNTTLIYILTHQNRASSISFLLRNLTYYILSLINV